MSDLLQPTHDVYVSGPMSGYPDLNVGAFADETEKLRAQGLTVISPHEFVQNQDALERDLEEHGDLPAARQTAGYLRYDVTQVASVRAVQLIPGWYQSTGANIEALVALLLGIPVLLPHGLGPLHGLHELNHEKINAHSDNLRREGAYDV